MSEEQRFRLLVEHSVDGIALTGEDNVIQYISPGAVRILGYEPGEIEGTSALLITHPDDVAKWRAPAPGEISHFVARVRHRDGSWRWIESTTRNLTRDPAVRAYVTNYRDITDKIRSETNFRALIERAPTAIFVHRDGTIRYINPAGVALLGYARADEIVGRPILDFVHPDDREVVRARQQQVASTGHAPPGSGRMMRADGTTFVLEGEALLLDFDGEPANVVMGHDVTARDELFARVAMADRMLSVGTLAAGVAHEINNPLAYIASNLEVLAAELANLYVHPGSRLTEETLHALVADAREGVSRVSSLVRDLRTLSRRDDEGRRPVNVANVLSSSLKMTNNEVRHRARVVYSCAPDVAPVDAEPARLGQVFLNLLLNAAQAIVEGAADTNEIRVSVGMTPDRTRVCVEVEDTGSGIPAHALPRIFDPFFTTKAPGGGTGLGLSISRQYVRDMGGEIVVDSRPGHTKFTVLLPVSTGTPVTVPAASPVVTAGLRRRMLFIDDEAAVGRSLELLLAPEVEVVAVTRATDALTRLAAGEEFDVVVCDLMMPQHTGMELYDELARIAPAYLPRTLFVTGGAFTPQAREFLGRVKRPLLEKPFTEQQLRSAIATVTGPL